MNYSGVVSNVTSFDYNGKKLWSFQLSNVRTYFRLGDSAPKMEKGQFVSFTGSADAKGNVKVDIHSINSKPADAKTEIAGIKGFRTAVQTASTEMTSNGYWEMKTMRDIETQKRIEIQSCRNSALQFIQILSSNEALKLPTKNRLEFLEALLEHYIVEFQGRNTGATAPAVEAAPEDATEEAA